MGLVWPQWEKRHNSSGNCREIPRPTPASEQKVTYFSGAVFAPSELTHLYSTVEGYGERRDPPAHKRGEEHAATAAHSL